jgi:hypothetical protein
MANKLETIRSLTAYDFARAYKYSLIMDVPPTSFNLSALVANIKVPLTVPGSGAPMDFNSLISGCCTAIMFPSVGSQEIPVDVGTVTMRLAGKHETSGTVSPEFIQPSNYTIYKFFKQWNRLALADDSDGQTFQSSYLATLTIKQYDIQDTYQKGIKLYNVWCRNCPEIAFSDDSNDVVRFSPDLAYEFAELIKNNS